MFASLALRYLATRNISDRYAADLQTLCRRLDEWWHYSRWPRAEEMLEWLRAEAARRSPATVNTHRRMLLALCRFGRRNPRLPAFRETLRPPMAWTVDEFSKILATASRRSGRIAGVSAGDWWVALLLTIYWTGARIGSVMSAAPHDADLAAALLILTKTKNGRVAVYRLHVQAVEALRRIYDPCAARLFAWPRSRWTLFRQLRRIVELAGVPCPRTAFNLFHRLRRTTLSYCWAADPGLAQRQADHSTPELTRRRYVDPRIAGCLLSAADVLPRPEF